MKKDLQIFTTKCDEDSLMAELGIDMEKHSQLEQETRAFMDADGSTYGEVMAQMSQKVANANELAYVCFQLGSMCAKGQSSSRGLDALLSQLSQKMGQA